MNVAFSLPRYVAPLARTAPVRAAGAAARARGHWLSMPAAKANLATVSAAPAKSRPLSTEAKEAPAAPAAPAEPAKEEAPPGRFVPTLEVIVSKIFPAGFGWQGASVIAGQQGYEADTLGFALMTGAGDFAGVFLGHTIYTTLKAVTGSGGPDPVGGLWLGTAAACSGTAWQPCVNFLHDAAGCSFKSTFVACGAVTGTCFFIGLRLGRILYKPLGLEGATYDNLCGDAMLSVSIGAATGTFVGTDISFADNVIRPFFGVEDSMSDLEGMIRAGASTSTGFLFMQSAQNIVLPTNANWLDPVKLEK